jgi:integrase
MNPAREVKTERFSRTEGKTPAFVEGEVQKLLAAIETTTHTGLRDRALLGVLAYTFARIGAVVNLKIEDYYPSGKRFLLRIKEKGGQRERASRVVGAAALRIIAVRRPHLQADVRPRDFNKIRRFCPVYRQRGRGTSIDRLP